MSRCRIGTIRELEGIDIGILKGCAISAQGNALGQSGDVSQALKGRANDWRDGGITEF